MAPTLLTFMHHKALEEARDINIFLKPLERHIEDLENTDFSEVKVRFAPLMHTVCLVWANSKYYNTPVRVIVLLQEVCNLLIQQVCYKIAEWVSLCDFKGSCKRLNFVPLDISIIWCTVLLVSNIIAFIDEGRVTYTELPVNT